MTTNNETLRSKIEGLFGLLVAPNVGVAENCSPMGLGLGGNSCNSQTVCCENNSFNGLIALGCTSININL
jgi:hypothetical protein